MITAVSIDALRALEVDLSLEQKQATGLPTILGIPVMLRQIRTASGNHTHQLTVNFFRMAWLKDGSVASLQAAGSFWRSRHNLSHLWRREDSGNVPVEGGVGPAFHLYQCPAEPHQGDPLAAGRRAARPGAGIAARQKRPFGKRGL